MQLSRQSSSLHSLLAAAVEKRRVRLRDRRRTHACPALRVLEERRPPRPTTLRLVEGAGRSQCHQQVPDMSTSPPPEVWTTEAQNDSLSANATDQINFFYYYEVSFTAF